MAEVATVGRMRSVAHTPDSEPQSQVLELTERTSPPIRSGEWRAGWGYRLLSLAPFEAAFFNAIAGPSYFRPMVTAPTPMLLGLPLDTFLYLWFLTLGALGSAIVWQARSPRVVYSAFFACTLPATFGLLLFPALVLILQNLKV